MLLKIFSTEATFVVTNHKLAKDTDITKFSNNPSKKVLHWKYGKCSFYVVTSQLIFLDVLFSLFEHLINTSEIKMLFCIHIYILYYCYTAGFVSHLKPSAQFLFPAFPSPVFSGRVVAHFF